jgi:hypothetical protein
MLNKTNCFHNRLPYFGCLKIRNTTRSYSDNTLKRPEGLKVESVC